MHTRSKKQPLLYDREVEKTVKKNHKQAKESRVGQASRKKTVEAIEPDIEEMDN